jgi:hypothetical protein
MQSYGQTGDERREAGEKVDSLQKEDDKRELYDKTLNVFKTFKVLP